MASSENISDEQIRPQSYWRWSKQDFFPEESFRDWGTYRHALSHTHSRFKDRLLTRSQDSDEIEKLRKESENDMKRCLNWWDLMWFGFGAIIGAGIFVLTGQEAHNTAGPAIVLSYVASGVSAMLSVFCYTEFAIEIPVAGGSFAYLRVELGDFAAFITAGNILLECILGGVAVARSWTSYFTTLINRESNSLRIRTNLADGYNLLDPIAVVVLVIAATIAMTSTRKTSSLNWIASAINTVVILFVIIAGFWHADTSNMKPFTPYGVEGVFRAAAIVYFAYGGFDTIATMAEETKNPSRDIPLGLLGSMSIITIIYCLMALSLTMMQKYSHIDPNAAYPVAFEQVGMKWAKYLVALGALKGMTTVLLVGALGQARYITHIARAHMIPPWFALVHPKTKTPINATLLVTISSAFIAFFSSLDILASLLSRDAWNRDPTIIEVFERTHCTNRDLVPGATGPPTDAPIFLDGSHEGWSTSWHQTARSEYPDVDDPRTLSQEIQAQLWEQANPPKKDRVPGFNRVKDFLGLTGQGRRSCSAAPSDVETLRAELEEERRQRRLEQEAATERWRKYEEDRQRDARQQFDGFMQQFLSQNPSQMQAFMQQYQNQDQNPDQNPPS